MAAPKGNKFAVGNNGGRPRMYKSVSEMMKVIDEYFEYCSPKTDTDTGILQMEYPSVTGLALYLGFAAREGLYEYRDRQEFSYLIKRALLKVEMHYETTLNYKNATGAIFALKNMGWSDKQETEHSGEIKITVEEKRIS